MDFIDEITDVPPKLDEQTEETIEDESIDLSTENVDTEEEPTQTEETQDDGTDSKIAELQAELDMAKNRMSDKDKYINELRNNNTKSEVTSEDTTEEDGGFWEDPESKFKELQFELAETRFASTRPDYYDVVNINEVNSAIAKDPEFANEFNSTANKFETAYKYLKQQQENIQGNEATMRAQMKEEIMAELNIKPKKEIPKSVNNIGNSNGGESTASSDGFSDVFGSSY